MKRIVTLVVLLPLLGIVCTSSQDAVIQRPDLEMGQVTSTRSNEFMPISNSFIDPQKFALTNNLKGLALSVKGSALRVKGSGLRVQPMAGVVNHHDLASDLQAKFFKALKVARPDLKTIIIISPDHFKAGQSISTHQLSYSTPAGLVQVDQSKAQKLVESGIWDATDARAFEKEHGVGALAPYIARELPDVKIVPIFIRANVTHSQLSKLMQSIKSIQDDNSFILISSDMSHGLALADARVHDVQTEKWLAQMDPKVLESATDANTDSGPSLSVLASLLDKPEFVEIAHANSSDYVPDTKNTTSYIVGFWK